MLRLEGDSRTAPIHEVRPFTDPYQATFAGGRGTPLHDWFPYLEAYSPAFVAEVINRFAPQARCVLDPFAGLGTTPLTAIALQKKALYCDANPLCTFIIGAKVAALGVSTKDRCASAEKLEALARGLRSKIEQYKQDSRLAAAYQSTFGNSDFFAVDSMNYVLRTRSLLDAMGEIDPKLSTFATVAALRSLVPASRLIRRGDLRYRTPSECREGQFDFVDDFAHSLLIIAADLRRLEAGARVAAEFLCDDARLLGERLPGGVDCVVTSPPYLNGTNYFRNAKIELWFLRYLTSPRDLRLFRDRAITAGINDVTTAKSATQVDGFESERLTGILADLRSKAYDQRIPAMVSSYFAEMWRVFRGMVSRLEHGTPIAVDIGDSVYADIHVPTHEILLDMLMALGAEEIFRSRLRKRTSKGGRELSQELIVLRTVSQRSLRKVARSVPVPLPTAWQHFKAQLPHQQGSMAARNWGHPLHSLCSYPGKLKPSLASVLVETFVPPGGALLDPFAGVGTIPLEAALKGRISFSLEINPSAFAIANAKVHRPNVQELERVISQLEKSILLYKPKRTEIAQAERIRFNGCILDYFHSETFREILGARDYFLRQQSITPESSLVHACVQHILHGNRPYALSRRSHPITPFAPSGPVEYRSLIDRVRAKVARSLRCALPDGFTDGRAWQADCTKEWPDSINGLDAVITSPPFFDSTRFYMANWMRLWFSGWDESDFRDRPADFVDVRQKQSFCVYDGVLRQAKDRLKLGGIVVLHLGKSAKCDMSLVLEKIARPYFKTMDRFVESVLHCERHGIRDKGTVTSHQYLILG